MSTIGYRQITRWDTPFGRWVHDVGVSRIVAALGRDPDLSVTTHSVYDWVSGRTVPAPARGVALVRLSRGRLTLETIYAHRDQVRHPAGAGAGHGDHRGGMQQR